MKESVGAGLVDGASPLSGPLKLCLVGRVRVRVGETELELSGQRSRALLGIVALHAPASVSRDSLATLLWSTRDQDKARAALRQALHRLRDDLGPHAADLLVISADHLTLRQPGVWIDTRAALDEVQAGRVPPLLADNPLAFTDLLSGLDFIDPALSNILTVKRSMMHDEAVAGLESALAGVTAPDPRGADIARVLIAMEPTHEPACRYMMRFHFARGSISAALLVYERLWKVLDEDFDAEPSEESQSLIVAIKQADDRRSGDAGAVGTVLPPQTAPPPEPAVPVANGSLPATRLPRKPPVVRVESFASADLPEGQTLRILGLRQDFIGALCRFRDWRVVDAGWGATPRAEGDVQVFSITGVAISGPTETELVLTFRDAVHGDVIWSERVLLNAESWGRTQRRMVRRIAIAASLHLSAHRLSHLAATRPLDLSAHDAWLLGQALMSRWRPESEDQAEAIFRAILAEHPDFAPACVGLAQVLNARHHMRPGVYRSRRLQAEALDLCLRAVTLDPLDARAQLTLAWSFALNDQHDNAVQTFRIACDLNENDPWTLVSSSLGLAYCGEQAEATLLGGQMLELGLDITPLHWAYNAGVCFMARDYAGAASAAARSAGATWYITAWQAAAHAHQGQIAEARTLLDRYVAEMTRLWSGPEPASAAAIIAWLLHCYPIRTEAAWRTLRDGLARAGAPVPAERPGPEA